MINYFNPADPIAFLSGDLPHWRQDGTTYFVTFRLADSLPAKLLDQWSAERHAWISEHPEPHDEATRRDYYERFPQRLQRWLDAGAGSCILADPQPKYLVETALRHFNGERYNLDDSVVAPNHVHAILTPLGGHALSEILHSWKSFTAHRILEEESAEQSLREFQADQEAVKVWQKESFNHIVRSPSSLEKFREYIRAHTE